MGQESTTSFASNAGSQSIFYVIAMLLLIFIAAYLVTKFVGGKARIGAGQGRIRHMQVIETLSLGRDRSIVIVEVGGTYCLLGVSSQSITLLETYDPDTLTPVELSESAVMGTARTLADRLLLWNRERKGEKGAYRTSAERRESRPPSFDPEDDEMEEILSSIQERRMRYERDQEDRRP